MIASPHAAVLIPGDGIGPEVSGAVQQVLEAAGAPLAVACPPGGIGGIGGR